MSANSIVTGRRSPGMRFQAAKLASVSGSSGLDVIPVVDAVDIARLTPSPANAPTDFKIFCR